MLNRVCLVGYVQRDIGLNATKGGLPVTQFTLGVPRDYKTKDGKRKSDYISCVAWRKTAEVLHQYATANDMLAVDGRIQTRSYDDRNGQKVYVTEVLVKNVSFINTHGKNSQSRQNGANAGSQKQDPFQGQTGNGVNIKDSDLPF